MSAISISARFRHAPFEDAFLAATARVHGLTIVTRNTKDFSLFDVPILNPFLHRGV